MAYFGLVTKINNVRKDENSERLYLADCFGEGVIVGPELSTGDLVLYLPTDGRIARWFGDQFNLFRKNEDGTSQGGYLEDNGHVRAIKLRGNQSSGVVISVARLTEKFGDLGWKDGDTVNEINGREFCTKYIPHSQNAPRTTNKKTSYKGRKAEGIEYPEFAMHSDTAQLAYNLGAFHEGDLINMTLKMHGTSQRSMHTYAAIPNNWFRRFLHLKKKTKDAYVLGTRRCVVTENSTGYYGNDAFRLPAHKALEPFVLPGMEIFYEVVGYYGAGESNTIMPIVSTDKVGDKKFTKRYGKQMAFTYGCEPGESNFWIYRITSENGAREWTPAEITAFCETNGFNRVPIVEDFTFTTVEDLQDRINKYFEDLTDPIGKTHIKEGVVVRIVNRRTFTAFKSKTYEFKVLEGIVKETATTPDMEEAQEVDG